MQKPLWCAGALSDLDHAIPSHGPSGSLLLFSFMDSPPPSSTTVQLLLSGSSLTLLNISTNLRAFGPHNSSPDTPRKHEAYLIIGFTHLSQKYFSFQFSHAKCKGYLVFKDMTCPHSYSNQIPENRALNPLLNPISNPSTQSDDCLLWSEYEFCCNSLLSMLLSKVMIWGSHWGVIGSRAGNMQAWD